MPFRGPPNLEHDAATIVALAAAHCRLPHPDVVAQCSAAIFPTIRNQQRRGTVDAERRLLLDDNVTPRWALFWAHGMPQTHHPRGWTIAHVWAASKDPDAYTHLANLCLMPESLASLSDKAGPLCRYLQYHSFQVYGWRPTFAEAPDEPSEYNLIKWTYFDPFSDPWGFIKERVMTLSNQRVAILRTLMGLTDA